MCARGAGCVSTLSTTRCASCPPIGSGFHTCYSINQGPRKYELGLDDVIDLVLGVNAGAYSFEAANPRHEHEWRVWQQVDIGEQTVLIPGFVTNSSVMIE